MKHKSYNDQKIDYITKGSRPAVNYDKIFHKHKKGEKSFGSLHGSALSKALTGMKKGIARGKN